MGFTTPGTPVTERAIFNSGTIDFGSKRMVDVDNIKIDLKWNSQRMYVLNSIKTANIARSNESVTLTGLIKSMSPEMMASIYGSVSSGATYDIQTYDGQPSLQSPVVTLYDSAGKEYQYQISGAIFTTNTMTAAQEAYTTWDFTIEAKDITLISST